MFYENKNFIIAGAAVVGFVVGLLVMWVYQWFKHRKEIKEYQERISQQDATIKLQQRTEANLTSKISELNGEINELKTLDPLLQKRQDDYKKWDDKTKAQIDRFFYLSKVLSKLEIKASVKVAREEKATKKTKEAENKARWEEAKKKDDEELEELKKRSKGISTTKPKNTR